MVLTPKQESFCLAYMETGNASEAYRRSYNAGKMLPATISKRAKELLSHGGITGRLEEIRRPVLMKAQLTLEAHLEDLKALRNLAKDAGKYGAAVSAEVSRGKAAGLYVTKPQVDVNDLSHLTDEQLESRLAILRAKFMAEDSE